ncbi:MAG: ribonuclease H-like domain-containing protein [Candidatus Obscuribacterales bacterium]|nr:ribonuclease H-like domain-containing protein [Candidatus Obscuribacterales bacterium]
MLVKSLKPDFYELDLPDERLKHYLTKPLVTVDTETRGLIPRRDRLCLIQICDEDGVVSLVRYKHQFQASDNLGANVKKLLEAQSVLKVFHFARFDVAVLKYYLNAVVSPIFCTKIGSKLVRTYTDRHSLKDLSRELIKVEMDKTDQSSDWAKDGLSDSQLEYAANDVRLLIPIYKQIRDLLERENRTELAQKVIQCLPAVCDVDLGGWTNIFEH